MTKKGSKTGMRGAAILAVAIGLAAIMVILAAQNLYSRSQLHKQKKAQTNNIDSHAIVDQAISRTSVLLNSGFLRVVDTTVTLFDPELAVITAIGDVELSGNELLMKVHNPLCLRNDPYLDNDACKVPVTVHVIERFGGSDAYVRINASFAGVDSLPPLDKSAAILAPPLKTEETCTNITEQSTYNIIMIFDRSGSQSSTDPTNVRRAGALDFISKFGQVVKENPSLNLNVQIIRFTTNALVSPQSWVGLHGSDSADAIDTNLEVLRGEIDWATLAPGGGTKYVPAFDRANAEMAAKLATLDPGGADGHVHNFTIFLTDGEPNNPERLNHTNRSNSILDAVEEHVNTNQTIVYAIASGRGLREPGAALVARLALPAEPPGTWGGPATRGEYYRARNAEDLMMTFDKTFTSILTTRCTNKTVMELGTCVNHAQDTNFPSCLESLLLDYEPGGPGQ